MSEYKSGESERQFQLGWDMRIGKLALDITQSMVRLKAMGGLLAFGPPDLSEAEPKVIPEAGRQILKEINYPLIPESIAELTDEGFKMLARQGLSARLSLRKINAPLIPDIVHRLMGEGFSKGPLGREATRGLEQALDEYDPNAAQPFPDFARSRIEQVTKLALSEMFELSEDERKVLELNGLPMKAISKRMRMQRRRLFSIREAARTKVGYEAASPRFAQIDSAWWLSDEEIKVLQAKEAGMVDPEVAAELFVERSTVTRMRARARKKLETGPQYKDLDPNGLKKSERLAWDLRRQGLSYQKIAVIIGRTYVWARKLVLDAAHKVRDTGGETGWVDLRADCSLAHDLQNGGQSIEEIAQMLDWPEPWVRTVLAPVAWVLREYALTEEEGQVLEWLDQDGLTLEDAGARLGMSRGRLTAIRDKAYKKQVMIRLSSYDIPEPPMIEGLSRTESQVIHYLNNRVSTSDVALLLQVSERRVRKLRTEAAIKLGVPPEEVGESLLSDRSLLDCLDEIELGVVEGVELGLSDREIAERAGRARIYIPTLYERAVRKIEQARRGTPPLKKGMLSANEWNVLAYAQEGLSYGQIGTVMGLSSRYQAYRLGQGAIRKLEGAGVDVSTEALGHKDRQMLPYLKRTEPTVLIARALHITEAEVEAARARINEQLETDY